VACRALAREIRVPVRVASGTLDLLLDDPELVARTILDFTAHGDSDHAARPLGQ
jgi:hypothetical protein